MSRSRHPPKPRLRDNLDTTISIRVTADEAQALELLAFHDDLSTSRYVRRLIRLALDEALAGLGEE